MPSTADKARAARDPLAYERTLLANERTLLAYIRTALAFLAAGLGFLHLLDSLAATVLGWLFVPSGLVVFLLGRRSYRASQKWMDENASR